MLNMNRNFRIIFLQTGLDRTCNTTCDRISTSGGSSIMQGTFVFKGSRLDLTRIKHRIQFLKSQNKIHITSHSTAHRFQFLGSTRSNEDNLRIRIILLYLTCSGNHRSQLL